MWKIFVYKTPPSEEQHRCTLLSTVAVLA